MRAEGLRRSVKEEKESKYWIIPMLLVMAILPPFVGEYYLSILNLCGVYLIATVGLDILTGICGQISLGHSAFVALGAYTYGFLANMAIAPWMDAVCDGRRRRTRL